MPINKVIYGDRTLIDLSDDTVSASSMLSGVTAHDKSGNTVEGDIVFAEAITVDEIKPNSMIVSGTHCDANGIWHYPVDEWSTTYNGVVYDNNIELIPIDFDNDEEVIYLLYDCRDENAFCSIRIRQACVIEYGLSKNGVFTSLGAQEQADNKIFSMWLMGEPFTTLVIKVTPQDTKHLWHVSLNAWVSDGSHTAPMGSTYNSVLMRYGNLPYGSSIVFVGNYLESDNVVNFAKNRSGEALTLNGAYSGCYNLQRWRNTGWNIANNYTTSLSSVFLNANALVDLPDNVDFSGWCSNRTTTLYSFLCACFAWKSSIDVTGWDLSAITRADYLFSNCLAIEEIKGLSSWIGGTLCTTWAGMFDSCYNLKSDIDLSNLIIGSSTTSLRNMFGNCYKVQTIVLPGLDLSNVINTSSMFATCRSLKSILHGEIIPPSNGVLTTAASMFTSCSSLTTIDFLKNIDLSSATITSLFSYCLAITDSKLLPIGNLNLSVSNSFSSTSVPYVNCKNLIYLDESWLDVNYDSSSGKALQTAMLQGCACVIDFYPPKNLKNVSFSISGSQRLSHDSLMRVINALPQGSSKLTMGTFNLDKLTDEEKAVATQKGWTLA